MPTETRQLPLTAERERWYAAACARLDAQRLKRLLIELIDIPSPTGAERTASEFVAARMRERLGPRAFYQPISEDTGNAVGELRGSGNGATLLLYAPIDTHLEGDPARAQEMRELQANFGKTWLAGRVTAVNETKVTLHSAMDDADHTFVADENTTFRRRREPVTLADIEVGSNVRVEGSVKEGVFVASSVNVAGPPVTGGPAPREGPPPQ